VTEQATGHMHLLNVEDEGQKIPDSFERRFLYHPSVESVIARPRHREALYRALRDRVIEVKASEFGSLIQDAKAGSIPKLVEV
jgi:hypothetical protein